MLTSRSIPVSILGILALFQLLRAASATADNELPSCRDYEGLWQTYSTTEVDFFEGRCLTLQDGTVYTAGEDFQRIYMLDVSDPHHPVHRGFIETPGEVTGLASRPGDLLATIDGVGLVRYDLGDPWNPQEVETLDLGFQHFDVVMRGDLAYVALGGTGVRVLTLEYSGLTVPLGQVSVGASARRLALDGDLLFVGANPTGLVVVDVTNPTTPQVLGDQIFPLMPRRIDAAHGRVVMTGGSVDQSAFEIWVYDVSDPTVPAKIADLSGTSSYRRPVEVHLAEQDRLLVGVGSRLVEYIIQDFTLLERGVVYNSASAILADGGLIFAVGATDLIIGPAVPLTPSPYATFSSYAGGYSLRRGDVILTVTGDGLRAYDLSDPGQPQAGQLLPLASDDNSPALAWNGSTAFVNNPGGSGVQLIDVSDPLEPVFGSDLNLAAVPWGLLAEGDLLYLATGHDGLMILDVAGTGVPPVVAQIPASQPAYARQVKMVKHGHELLVQAAGGGLDVFDVSDPASPYLAEHLAVSGTIRDLDLMGDRLLICRFPELLTIWQRGAEGWSHEQDVLAVPYSAAVQQDIFYRGTDFSPVEMYRLVEGQPVKFGVQENATAGHFLLAGEGWLAAASWSHLGILPGQCQNAVAAVQQPRPVPGLLGAPVPNPFNPRTELSFTLPVAGPVELVLHDLAGRRVCTLFSGLAPEGTTRVAWNGLDSDGRAMPSGVYLARLAAGGHQEVRKLALLR